MAYNPYLTNPYQYISPYQTAMPPITPTVPPPYQTPYSTQGQPIPSVQQPVTAPQTAPQAMTPPTVHAEIIQVKSADEVEKFPVNAGTSQLFQLADDSAFIIKSVFPNGQVDNDIYVKQPKKPAAPALDLSAFVTREELEERLAGIASPRKGKRLKDEPAADMVGQDSQ